MNKENCALKLVDEIIVYVLVLEYTRAEFCLVSKYIEDKHL